MLAAVASGERGVAVGTLSAWGWAAAAVVGLAHAYETSCYHQKLNNLAIVEQKVVALKTENGFYYSYYEEVVSAPTWTDGVWAALRDRRSEAPDTINAVERFNIYQELFCGLLLRSIRWIVGDLAPDSWYFFRYCLYAVNGAGRTAMLGLAASCGGGGLRGGALPGLTVALMLFLHHFEVSRFHELSIVNLREYWACPVIWMQVFCLYRVLACHPKLAGHNTKTGWARASLFWQAAFVFTTVLCTLLWQFSAFAFVLQVAALFLCVLLSSGTGPRHAASQVLLLHLTSLALSATLLFFNELLVHHVLVTECLAIYVVLWLRRNPPRWRCLFWVDGVLAVAVFLVIRLLQSPFASADDHMSEIAEAKFRKLFPESKFLGEAKEPSFNAKLYLAVSVFDFISYSTIEALMPTKVLHMGACGLLVVAAGFLRRITIGGWQPASDASSGDAEDSKGHAQEVAEDARVCAASFAHGVLVVQLMFFCMLGCFFDRLKILPGPLLCLLAGVALTPQPLEAILGPYTAKSSRGFKVSRMLIFVAAFLGQLTHLALLVSKMPFLGERSNSLHIEMVWGDADIGELCDWMTRFLPRDATMMDSMSLAGQIRPLAPQRHVIHPQFESRSLRERVQEIYKIYQCTPAETFVPTMKKFGAQFVIIEYRRCDFSPYPLDEYPEVNCKKEDRPWEDLFCVRLHTSRSFKMIFANSGYAIFEMNPNATAERLPPRASSIQDIEVWKPMLKRCKRDEPVECPARIAELADMFHTKLKQPEIASMLFNWALQAKPENGIAQYIYGHHLDYDINNPNEAIKYYRRAYELNPNNALIVREYLMVLDIVRKDNRTLESLLRTRRVTKGDQLSLVDLRDAALGCEAAVSVWQLMHDLDFAEDLWNMAKQENIGSACIKNNWLLFSPNKKPMEADLSQWDIFRNFFWLQAMRSQLSSGQSGAVRWQPGRHMWQLNLSLAFEKN